MSRYNGEQVLVVTRQLLEQLGGFQGVATRASDYLEEFLTPGNHFFIDREAAENDPSHKQLIPYTIFKFGDSVLHYTRGASGGEARLHAKGSIGIGGHINPIDWKGEDNGMETYLAGLEREWREEISFSENFRQKVLALINDDSSEVGAVHLGIVHLVELDAAEISANEAALNNLSFISLENLRGSMFENLETWSQLCLQVI